MRLANDIDQSVPQNDTPRVTESTSPPHLHNLPMFPMQPFATNGSGTGVIIGNRRSRIYHWQGYRSYHNMALKNRVLFHSRQEAEAGGYRPAKNCHSKRYGGLSDG